MSAATRPAGVPEPPLDAATVARLLAVSRETTDRLDRLLALLRRWQARINLVGRSTLEDAWRRHVLDSGQLVRHLPPGPGCITDIGSGAGFPGLVVALLAGRPVDLIEADARKAAFLREAARETGAAVTVHVARAEALDPWPADVVTARAVAPVSDLLGLAYPFCRLAAGGGRVLLLKGARVEAELTDAAQSWTMSVERHPSLSDPTGVVLRIEDFSPLARPLPARNERRGR